MKIRSFAALAVAAATATVAAGCGDSTGAGLVPVSGTVTLNGKPLEGANIEFIPPADSKDVLPGHDTTDAQGNYAVLTSGVPGVAPGKYTVVVTKYPEVKLEGAAAGIEGQPDPLMAQLTQDVEAQANQGRVSSRRDRDGKPKPKSSGPQKLEASFDREVPAAGGTINLEVEENASATATPKK